MSTRSTRAQAAGPPWRTRLAWGLTAAIVLTAATVAWLSHTPELTPTPDPPPEPATIARGAYLARVGNCAGCHTARGGPPLAGGRGLATPFGTVYAGNLTPDPETGLGRWRADDFWRAMHHGRSRAGRLLAPAFPFSSFTQVSRSDSDALYVYLRSLPAVVQATPPSGLRFPFSTQAALAVWRALYFRPAEPGQPGQSAESAQSAVWQRGAYLVRGLGHCAGCHAPRNTLGATQQAALLRGGKLPLQPWHAPSLAPVTGVALAQQQHDMVQLLQTGQSARGTASGPMADVVVNSTQYWSAQDLQAAAVYLLSLPTQPAPTASAEATAATAAESGNGLQRARGAVLYGELCASCHGEHGEGAPGVYPPLAGNPSVTLANPDNALQVLRHGGFSPTTAAQPRPYGMPPASLSPQELADVLTHIRQSWGNNAAAVSVLETMHAR
jgi:mono/diheme cytochrome c family protein